MAAALAARASISAVWTLPCGIWFSSAAAWPSVLDASSRLLGTVMGSLLCGLCGWVRVLAR